MAANDEMLNISVSSPLLAYSLYERCNHNTDFEGLIFGTYTVGKHSTVNDASADGKVAKHDLTIKKFPITGVRFSFYDFNYVLNETKLKALLEEHCSPPCSNLQPMPAGNNKNQLQLLGWFSFNRVFTPEWLATYAQISEQLKRFIDLNDTSLSYSWGRPLFFMSYERLLSERIKLDISECKYQMYHLKKENPAAGFSPMTSSPAPSPTYFLKPVKFAILNVGDTSHTEYLSIESLNSDSNIVVGDVQSIKQLTEDICTKVTNLANNSLEAINRVIQQIGMDGNKSGLTTNGANAFKGMQPERNKSREETIFSSPGVHVSKLTTALQWSARALDHQAQPCSSMNNWEMVDNPVDGVYRGQKREKGDHSCSSSGGNSDEMEVVQQSPHYSLRRQPQNYVAIDVGNVFNSPVGAAAHVTKKSRAGDFPSSGMPGLDAQPKPIGKSRGRNTN